MLVINRCKDESIIIDGCIEVKVIDARRIGNRAAKQVTLGITAPKHISVHRKEIQDAIDRENSLIKPGASAEA